MLFLSVIFRLLLLVFFPLFYSNLCYSALTVSTSQTIQGSLPRFSAELENDIQNGDELKLLGIKYDDINYFSSDEFSNKINSIYSASAVSPASIGNIGVAYDSLVSGSNVIDDDGDGDFNLSGASVNWYYTNSSGEFKLNSEQKSSTFCELSVQGITPYLKISGPITLSTKYGDPHKADYPNQVITTMPYRNLSLNFTPSVCFAAPNLDYGADQYNPNNGIWHSSYGFVNQSSSANNFPTTGANQLYFYLIINGLNAKNLNWQVASTGNVTATIAHSKASDAYGFVNFDAERMVRVTLSGPDVLVSDKNTVTAPTTKPDIFSGSETSPVKITITGTDNSVTPNTNISYSFELKKWFIYRGNKSNYSAASSNDNSPLIGVGNGKSPDTDFKYGDVWCSQLNDSHYTVPSISDLTNTSGYGWIGSSPSTEYQRVVGTGFFPEWGYISYYNETLFSNQPAWVKEVYQTTRRYIVFSNRGLVGWTPVTNGVAVVCVNQ